MYMCVWELIIDKLMTREWLQWSVAGDTLPIIAEIIVPTDDGQ